MYIEYRTLMTDFLLFLVKKGTGERNKLIMARQVSLQVKQISRQTVNEVRVYSLNPKIFYNEMQYYHLSHLHILYLLKGQILPDTQPLT
jgi:hypothetical protein